MLRNFSAVSAPTLPLARPISRPDSSRRERWVAASAELGHWPRGPTTVAMTSGRMARSGAAELAESARDPRGGWSPPNSKEPRLAQQFGTRERHQRIAR